jgi:hypothetical protein
VVVEPGGPTRLDHLDRDTVGATLDISGDQLVPGAPEDLFWAIGAYGQTLQVHPPPAPSSSGSAPAPTSSIATRS